MILGAIAYSLKPLRNAQLIQAIHDMRLSHQVIQHNMEIDAQKEHMRSREQELK